MPPIAKAMARFALQYALGSNLTPKEHVLIAERECHLDYREVLRNTGKPCWFIRHGLQGQPYTGICSTPRAAWKAAYDSLLDAIRKEAA